MVNQKPKTKNLVWFQKTEITSLLSFIYANMILFSHSNNKHIKIHNLTNQFDQEIRY